MAFLDQQPLRAIPDGQITQTVYGYIRDHKWQDAVEVLQAQLQVRRHPARRARPPLAPAIGWWVGSAA
jgi:hypothetical protein